MLLPESRSLHPPARKLNSHVASLTEFCHIYCPDGLNTMLFQGCVLGTAPTVGMVGKIYIFRMRADGGAGGSAEPLITPI